MLAPHPGNAPGAADDDVDATLAVAKSATALDLLEEDLSVWVVVDAWASRTERNRDAAFDRLAGAGVELVTTEMVLFEWLRGAEHPLFKQVQALVKD